MIRYLYLLLSVLGLALPGWQLLPFLREHGMNLSLLVEQLFANHVSGFFGLDVIVSSLVLWVFVFSEGRRRQMKHLWAYVVCNLLVGMSFALPLFLYMRERRMNKPSEAAAARP